MVAAHLSGTGGTVLELKAMEKLPNVYQHRTSSGMQWHGIQPVIHL